MLLILTELFLHSTPSATCHRAPLSLPSRLKLLQPCIPFDAKRSLNCSQHLYAAVCGESASNSNIHRDQPSPRILMDAALHCVDESRCVKLGQTWAEDTACELCYGTGCKNGYRAASGMGYVISLQRVMDTTARCTFSFFPLFPWRSSLWGILLSLVIEVTVNVVMGVAQGFVLKFMVRSQQENKTVMQWCMQFP